MNVSRKSFVVGLLIVLLTAAVVQAARPGLFDNGYFFYPDYNNGDAETFYVGESRTFNYLCHCGELPGNSVCNGYINLQVDSGSGFVNERSDVCNVGETETCYASYAKTFLTPGIYNFRVFCDESTGTDFVQSENDHVVLTVEDSCVDGETRLCPLQEGVCEGAIQTCVGGSWSACDYGMYYGDEELFGCDGLDNNCNGLADDVDADGDGSSPCGGMGFDNELLICGLESDYGRIDVFEYNPITSTYENAWTTDNQEIIGGWAGGEIGDLTHDGVDDFVIDRHDGSGYYLEVWTYDSESGEWYRVWYANRMAYIGDIGDFDNDGYEELMFSDSNTDTVEVWGNDVVGATSFSQEAVIKDCGSLLYHDAAGDLNGNGIPEIIFQCSSPEDIEIWEWNGLEYVLLGGVTPPPSRGTSPVMLIDDMECNGDVNMDGVNDCVFCGNSGSSHVLTYRNGTYFIDYSAPTTPGDSSYTQTCSIGDIDNDGYDDWFDSSSGGGLRVFSYKDGYYQQVWNFPNHGNNPPIGASFVGDADNDGKSEFLVVYTSDYRVELWESDDVEATSFAKTFTWSPSVYSANLIIGNINPYNDDLGVDCNDNDNCIYPGAPEVCGDGIDQDCDGEDLACNCVDGDLDGYYGYNQIYCPFGNDCDDSDYFVNPGNGEICGDGIDNNCNNEIDEGCGPVCGDGYCEGRLLGEDCLTCPSDCPSGERGVCCGDEKCDIKKGESSEMCSVDCA